QANIACASEGFALEDVGMPPDELGSHAPNDLFEVSTGLFLEQERQENALEEQVAELVDELRVVPGEGRVRHLVGLLDGVRDDRAHRLLAVPRALTAQALGELLELD